MKFDQFKEYNKTYHLDFPCDSDTRQAHCYNEEYYKVMCPEVEYIEFDRDESQTHSELSNLWGEQVGGLKIARRIKIHSHFKFTDNVKPRHGKVSLEYDHDAVFLFGSSILYEQDLFPEVGDMIVHNHIHYEIGKVYVDSNDLWAGSNIPLHITCEVGIYRPGDVKFKEGDKKV